MKQHAWRLGDAADWNTHAMLNAVPQNMRTSVQMSEKHCSQLQVKEAKSQLRGEKVGVLLRSLGDPDRAYKPKKG